MININDYLFDNCMSDVASSNEALTLQYLWRKAREEGGVKEQVQVQQLHIARICFCKSDKKGNIERFVKRIKDDLIQHGYIINTTVSWYEFPNKKKIRTTTWVLSKKSIKLLKEALKKCGYNTEKKQAKTAKKKEIKKENNINNNDMENNNNLTLFQQRQILAQKLKNT